MKFNSRTLNAACLKMSTGSLFEEVKDIKSIKSKVEDDPFLCEKVWLFVYALPEIQSKYKADASAYSFSPCGTL